MSSSLLGDLCREADWIRCRLTVLQRERLRCSSASLIQRFDYEAQSLLDRCEEIRLTVCMLERVSIDERVQLSLLKEIIGRTLFSQATSQYSHS